MKLHREKKQHLYNNKCVSLYIIKLSYPSTQLVLWFIVSVGEHAGVGTEIDKVTRGRDSIYDPFCTHTSTQCVYTGKSGRNGKFIVF